MWIEESNCRFLLLKILVFLYFFKDKVEMLKEEVALMESPCPRGAGSSLVSGHKKEVFV